MEIKDFEEGLKEAERKYNLSMDMAEKRFTETLVIAEKAYYKEIQIAEKDYEGFVQPIWSNFFTQKRKERESKVIDTIGRLKERTEKYTKEVEVKI